MPAPIVLVHQDVETRERALSALRAAGHEVAVFDDPLLALTTIEADGRTRVLVTGVELGPNKLNGIALARMVRLKQPGIRTVFVLLPEYERLAAELGIVLYRPLDPDALIGAVHQALAASATG